MITFVLSFDYFKVCPLQGDGSLVLHKGSSASQVNMQMEMASVDQLSVTRRPA
jgi:hypothetical protein